MASMNYDSLLKRLNKAIDNAQKKSVSSSVHVINFGEEFENLSGLVIIRHPDIFVADSSKSG